MSKKVFSVITLLLLCAFSAPVCVSALSLSDWYGETYAFSDLNNKITHTYVGWNTIYTDNGYSNPNFVFEVKMTPSGPTGAGNFNLMMYFISSTSNPNGTDGYYVIASCDGLPIRLVKIIGSIRTNLVTSSVVGINGTEYSIKVSRTEGSLMKLYIDGVYQGEANEAEFTNSNYFIIHTDAQGAAISDLNLGSPNMIVFESDRQDPNYGIYKMELNGWISGEATWLASGGSPALSPDGCRVAFEVYLSPSNPDIFVMDIDGSNITQLTDSSLRDSNPEWSPDGTKIVYTNGYVNGDNHQFDIYTMDADDGGNNTQLTS
ncbi:hypothetical protein KKB18_01445, partial [bacterium]|nr:hypothetical protein [bacterium]